MDFDLSATVDEKHVGVVEFTRGPNNFFSLELLDAIADAYGALHAQGARALVLASGGRHFCAGADFATDRDRMRPADPNERHLYAAGVRLIDQPLPVVAAVHGAAVGGGLGLALTCDFRVASTDARFHAPFARLGLHHGFGLSALLPRVVGQQSAARLLYTGERISASRALAIGLCDEVAEPDELRAAAIEFAGQIAANAPIALQDIRATVRGDLVNEYRAATAHERSMQDEHKLTADFAEGVKASLERRPPQFEGR